MITACEHAHGMQKDERCTDQTISVQKIDDRVSTQVKSRKSCVVAESAGDHSGTGAWQCQRAGGCQWHCMALGSAMGTHGSAMAMLWH